MTRNRQMTWLGARLVASGAVALALLTGSAASARGATSQPIVARMITAVSAATAFRVVIDTTVSGGGAMMGGASRSHLEMIRVRHGATTQMSVIMRSTSAKGPARVEEMVIVGTRGCVRMSHIGAWNCHYPPATFAAMATMNDPAKALQGLGLRLAMTPTGHSRTIGGQTCAVYAFTESLTTGGVVVASHGTWCLDAATSLPVEVDAVGSEAVIKGQPPFTTKSVSSYSRWNDPTLRVPAVPGI